MTEKSLTASTPVGIHFPSFSNQNKIAHPLIYSHFIGYLVIFAVFGGYSLSDDIFSFSLMLYRYSKLKFYLLVPPLPYNTLIMFSSVNIILILFSIILKNYRNTLQHRDVRTLRNNSIFFNTIHHIINHLMENFTV